MPPSTGKPGRCSTRVDSAVTGDPHAVASRFAGGRGRHPDGHQASQPTPTAGNNPQTGRTGDLIAARDARQARSRARSRFDLLTAFDLLTRVDADSTDCSPPWLKRQRTKTRRALLSR